MIPKTSTRHRWWSAGIIVWISLCSIPAIYGHVRDKWTALIIWIAVPWCGVLAYFRGRSDQKWEMREEESQPWLVEDLAEWLGQRRPYELMRFRTRITFPEKEE